MAVAALVCCGVSAPLSASEVPASPVSVDKGSKVPLRVLTRPGAVIYSDAETKNVVKSNVPTFTSFYVYTRPTGEMLASGSGVYEVGIDDQGTISGWIKGSDLFEWKQTMCLTFSHPDGRDPVLMFEDEDYLAALVNMPDEKRISSVDGYYSSIDEAATKKKPLPADFPVLSIEPKMAVDNSTNFTLIPIVDYRTVEFGGREARLLDIVAVNSTEKDRKSSDLRENTEYLTSATVTSDSQAGKLKDVKFDIVWVIDTTLSMGPYIQKVRENMVNISKQIAGHEELSGRVAFGVWGYRDSETIKGLEYVTKNFTPELQSVDAFAKTMDDVRETKVDSVIFDEDVFSGVSDAITQTAWRDGAVRIVILVGDAPGHELGHEWNVSGYDENILRSLANENNIVLYAVHLNPAKTKKFNKIAARQFKTLSMNDGGGMSMYWSLAADDIKGFDDVSSKLTGTIVKFATDAVANFKSSGAEEQPAAAETTAAAAATTSSASAAKGPTEDDIMRSLHAATVTWLGNEVNVVPPRDIEAWVVDKDLKESTRQTMEVRLLMTKSQLDEVAVLLKDVLIAGETGQVSGESFFSALQAASAVAARNPEKLANAKNIATSGLVPDFLSNLPYKSNLMEMNNEVWESWGPDEQNSFLANLEAKIKAYSAIHDDTSQWIALNPDDDPDDYVAPVPLDLMP